MVVIKRSQEQDVLKLAESMGLSCYFRQFSLDKSEYSEVLSSCKPFLAIVRKRVQDNSEYLMFDGL